MSDLTTTTVFAVYGAVLATVVAAWNIFREVTDRGRLRVQVVNMEMVQGGKVIAKNRLHFKVTNVGRKAIVLDRIGGGLAPGQERSHFLIFPPTNHPQQLPVKLEPGEMFSDWSTEVKPADAQRVEYYAAWDSIGREYRAPERQRRALFDDMFKG